MNKAIYIIKRKADTYKNIYSVQDHEYKPQKQANLDNKNIKKIKGNIMTKVRPLLERRERLCPGRGILRASLCW